MTQSGSPRRVEWVAVSVAALVLAASAAAVTVAIMGSAAGPNVRVPDLSGLDEAQATARIEAEGLVAHVWHRQDTAVTGVVDQSPSPGTEVLPRSAVDITVAVSLSAPTLLTPAPSAVVPRAPSEIATYDNLVLERVGGEVNLTWAQAEEYVNAWRVTIVQRVCLMDDITASGNAISVHRIVTEPRFSTISYRVKYPVDGISRMDPCLDEVWTVSALDDFGQAGPSATSVYWLPDSPGRPPDPGTELPVLIPGDGSEVWPLPTPRPITGGFNGD